MTPLFWVKVGEMGSHTHIHILGTYFCYFRSSLQLCLSVASSDVLVCSFPWCVMLALMMWVDSPEFLFVILTKCVDIQWNGKTLRMLIYLTCVIVGYFYLWLFVQWIRPGYMGRWNPVYSPCVVMPVWLERIKSRCIYMFLSACTCACQCAAPHLQSLG